MLVALPGIGYSLRISPREDNVRAIGSATGVEAAVGATS
jgi:hypothetical protein